MPLNTLPEAVSFTTSVGQQLNSQNGLFNHLAQQYVQFGAFVFANSMKKTAQEVVAEMGTSAANYFLLMGALKSAVIAADQTLIADNLKELPMIVTANQDGTVTLA